MSFILLGILNSQAAAAGGAGAYDLLETTVLTSSASSVSFTGLDSYTDYKHLQIRAVACLDQSIDNLTDLLVQFNSNTGSNYARHRLEGDGSSVTSSAATSGTYIDITDSVARNPATDIFGGAVIDILDFSSSNKNTTLRSLSGGNTSGENSVLLTSGLYNSTDAITQVDFSSFANFATGSRFSLYGIKG